MSEELTPTRKMPRKPLGRGLGSLLGEPNKLSEDPLPAPVSQVKPVVVTSPSATPIAATTVTTAAPTVAAAAKPASAGPVSAPPTPVAAPAAPAPTVTLNTENRVWTLSIEKVNPNKDQPRKIFAPEQLKELADSIKEKGIIQPILVRSTDKAGQYEIIAGERRWRAAQLAGLKEVPALIKSTTPRETLELALIENIQRADLNPIEEAEAYAHLAKSYNLTQQEMAQKVGKERVTVANVMRLLQLHPEVRDMVKRNELQLGQAKVLLALTELDLQLQVAKKAVRQGLTVRALEKLVAKAKESGDDLDILDDNKDLERKMMKELETELQKRLGTRVNIEEQGGKGKLTIHFYSIDELNQVVDRIRK